MKPFHLEIVTPDGLAYSGEVESLLIRTDDGDVEILCGHADFLASIGALDTPDAYFEAVKEEYIKRRDFMIDGLNRMEGVYTPLPMGAFYTIAELPVDDTELFAKWMLENFRIDNQTTMVTPAASFYKTPGKGMNHARIAYVLEIDEMKKALHILEEGLKAYPGRTI